MIDYSQNGEQQIFFDYFKDKKGILLDIGANDGITLSNSYALIKSGWTGVLVEPSEECCHKIFANHIDKSLEIFNVAISDKEGEFTFFESGTHLNNGDTSLLSTLKESELDRWKGTDNKFEKKKCKAIKFETLLKRSSYKQFDFITIDAEGYDIPILKQIDLSNTSMLCIEYNNNHWAEIEITEYCYRFGLELYHKNFENLIFAR